MPNKILAKTIPYEESLIVHTENVLLIWYELKKRYSLILKKENDFWEKSFLSILFHDFGKVVQNFQLVIQDKKKYKKEEYIRHEFLSGVFLFYSDVSGYKKNPFSLFSVFSHHRPLIDTLFQDYGAYVDIEVIEDDMNLIFDDFNQKIKEYGLPPFNSKLVKYCINKFKKKTNGLSFLYDDFDRFFLNFRETFIFNLYHRKEYILYKAILNIADWTASGHSQLPTSYLYSIEYLNEKIVSKLRDEGKESIAENFSFRQFQLGSKIIGSVLAIAPTGSGKTEASLIWASNKPEYSKVLYLLPTRVTSNAIYTRLKYYFGEANTAIVHSSALLYRKEIDDEKQYDKIEYLKDKTFFRNITVCTIDQVLTLGFNLGYWEIKTFHLLHARIIIDEIHLYQPYTLGLIVATIEYLKEQFEAAFFIMTATLPSKLKGLLQKTLKISKQNLIQDTELLNAARNTFEIRDKLVDEMDKEIKKAILTYDKVLIVVNTVDEAIRIYEKYKSTSAYPICLHSRFIQKDRFEKEQDILKREKENLPMLLIATQVVEVSLDIDFDILFTENAPIDAIIQRAGRVNRKRNEEKNSKVIIFRHQQVSEEKVYNESGILIRTFEVFKNENSKKLTEKQLNELVDEVYKDFNVENHPSFIDGKKMYSNIQAKHHFIKDNTELEEIFTREGLDSINIIPSCFEEELRGKSEEEKTKYELSIRRTKQYKFKRYPDKKHPWFFYLECDYDPKTGLKFKRNTLELH